MARRLRLHIAGMTAHVMQRGNNRCDCFGDDSDRLLYLSLLADASAMHECSVHAFVLMTNHVHLLVTGHADHAISRMMKRIGERYARAFNKKHRRTGTLWEGRFLSSVVDTRSYLLTCQRYIECNPVRAAMVRDPSEYPWSSFRHNALGEPSAFVSPHAAYVALSGGEDERRIAYRALFATPESGADLDLIRACVNTGLALGDEAFIREVERLTGRPASRRPGGRPRRKLSGEGVSRDDNLGLTPVLRPV